MCVTVCGKFTNHDQLTYFRLPYNPSHNKLSQDRRGLTLEIKAKQKLFEKGQEVSESFGFLFLFQSLVIFGLIAQIFKIIVRLRTTPC